MEHKIHLKNGESISETIANAPTDGRLHIRFSPGIWREKLFIERANVVFEADQPGASVITYADHNGAVRGGRSLGTGDSATVTVAAASFSAKGMTFSNDFDYLKACEENRGDPAKRHGTQAVAFRTVSGAADTLCEDCTFLGWQDTLYCDVGTHLFSRCRIHGNIDFIFGAGIALFESCSIISRYSGAEGYICAPSTKEISELGFCFFSCKLEKEASSMPAHSVWLGRPWHPGGATDVSCAATFLSCDMDDHIIPEGWTTMHSRTKDGLERTWHPHESRFSEYGSRGAGAGGSGPDRMLLARNQAAALRQDYFKAVDR